MFQALRGLFQTKLFNCSLTSTALHFYLFTSYKKFYIIFANFFAYIVKISFQYLKNVQITTKCLLFIKLKFSTRPTYKIQVTHTKSQKIHLNSQISNINQISTSFSPSMCYNSSLLNYVASSHHLCFRIKRHVLTCLL